jgi:cysteine-rich repeat protein
VYQVKVGKRTRRCDLIIVIIAAIVAVIYGSSCFFDTKSTLCETTGLRCKQGQVCALNQDVCIDIDGCGDGVVGEGEVCDDGNVIEGDNCSANCKSLEWCGNGIVDRVKGESCDDSNYVAGDDCDPYCQEEICGNGELDDGEVCDDDNAKSGDGCRNDCRSNEACGNGIKDEHLGEECEFENAPFPESFMDTDECDNDCTEPQCGDGHVNAMFKVVTPIDDNEPDQNEECDPGILDNNETQDSPGCDSNCTFVECGDGHINRAMVNGHPLEECDMKGSGGIDLPNCDGDCTSPRCGDFHTNPKFVLDDIDHDPPIKEECDDGAQNTINCDGNCTLPKCGDGYVNSMFVSPDSPLGEQCDTGDMLSNDIENACRTDCRLPFCGDGVIDTNNIDHVIELCDPGGAIYNKPGVGCGASFCKSDCSGCT